MYVALLLALRVFGKREIGQFTVFDLVFVLLVANALQPAMTGPDSSLTGGLVLIVALVAANYLVGQLDRIPAVHRVFTPAPAVMIKNGKYINATMEREGITEDEVDMAIREHGLEGAKEVRLAELEADGSISVVPIDAKARKSRRRVRFIRRD